MRGKWWKVAVVCWLAAVFFVGAAGQQKVIRVMVGKEDVTWWQKSVELACQIYPELKEFEVVYETPPDIKVAFFAAFGANQAPDILAIDSFEVPSWAEAKYLYDITDYVMAWDGWAQYPKPLQEIVKYDGKVYALLKQTDVRILFLRKDLLPYAIGSQWQPLSWSELLDMARALKAAGVEYPIALQSGRNWDEGTTMQAFLPLLYGAGGMLYDWEKSKWVVSSPAYLDALFFYRTVYAEGLANPDVPTIVNPWNVALGDFQAGKTAIYCDGQWAWGAFKPGADFEVLNAEVAVGFIKIPGEEAGFSTFSGGHAYAIANKGLDILTPFPDAAFKLLSVHLSQERMADFCLEKEWVAPRLDVARVPEYAENKYLAWCVARVLPYTEYRPALPEYSDVSLQIQLMVERVATLEMTPEQALTEFAKAVVGIVGPENTIDELSLLK